MKREKKYFRICPRCGSPEIFHISSYQTITPAAGVLGFLVEPMVEVIPLNYRCRSCGYEGFVIEVEDVEKYRKNLKINKGGLK
ncbi:hypothetical protein HY991_00135 [Candidatus Micrarchaeota archaeon]|nr:hypothetical protein [Candidatus Micrarchaeota archaeon]